MREVKSVLAILPKEGYYRELLLEGLKNLQSNNRSQRVPSLSTGLRIKVLGQSEVKDFEFQHTKGNLKSISRKEVIFEAPNELIKIDCGDFDRVLCPIVEAQPD
jgi:hypothetical protein